MVIAQKQHIFLMSAAHNDIGHHGVYMMSVLLTECYWWPYMAQDITWFILSCTYANFVKPSKLSFHQL